MVFAVCHQEVLASTVRRKRVPPLVANHPNRGVFANEPPAPVHLPELPVLGSIAKTFRRPGLPVPIRNLARKRRQTSGRQKNGDFVQTLAKAAADPLPVRCGQTRENA